MAVNSTDPAAPEEKVVELPAVTVTAAGDLEWKSYRMKGTSPSRTSGGSRRQQMLP